MSSSGRHTNESSPKKKIKWYTHNFQGKVVERSRAQRLAADEHWQWKFDHCKCCQITVRNANNSMLLRYNNSDKHKSS